MHRTDESALLGSTLLAEMAKDRAKPKIAADDLAAKKSLESIYSIETIDLKTVKPLTKPKESSIPVSPVRVENTLDLGDRHRGWLESFLLYAPIQVLPLPKAMIQQLQASGRLTLRDLIAIDWRKESSPMAKEVAQILSRYLEGKIIKGSSHFDFAACLLAPEMIPSSFKRIYAAYILPWIEKRGGVATKEEVRERWNRIALQPVEAARYLQRFTEDPFEKEKGFGGLYYSDSAREEWAKAIDSVAKSYFYNPEESYLFDDFLGMIERELAKNWISYPELFLRGYFQRSPDFWVAKGPDHRLKIILS